MTKSRFALNLLTVSVCILAFASFAQAQATRTWVSGVGDDVNPCSRTAPCKTFAGAISKTANGGEINALDPAGYGAVNITKSLTIDGNETHASILASSTTGIIVNATATDRVIIRNLSINGSGGNVSPFITGVDGIRWLAGDKLIIENCTIFRFNNNLINVNKSTSGNLVVNGLKGTTSLGAVANQDGGIRITTSAGTIRASIANSVIQDCKIGISIQDNVFANIRDTTITGNGGATDIGVRVATNAAGATTRAHLEGVTISQVNEGIRTTTAGANLSVQTFISNCNIFKCTTAGVNTGANAQVTSSINNRFHDNGGDIAGPFTTKAQQ